MNQSANLPDTSLVMVAVIPSIRDLDIARLLGWYRIPLKSAPKIIAVDYIAFYQTSAFPKDQQAQIHWLAPILGHELTTRAELTQEERPVWWQALRERALKNEEYQANELPEIPLDPALLLLLSGLTKPNS